jgi:hypothetical protein
MEIVAAAIAGGLLVWLLARSDSSSGSCMGNGSISTNTSGAHVQFLQPSGPPGNDYTPPALSSPMNYSHMMRPITGSMLIYPVSNNGQGITTPPPRITKTQARY